MTKTKSPNILYVEDMPDAFTLVKVLLRPKYNLFWAQNPDESLKILDEKEIHLILMDISLKEKNDGYDLAVHLKNHETYSKIPIIALTAYALKGDKERFLSAGMNDYIPKPVNKNELINKINANLLGLNNL